MQYNLKEYVPIFGTPAKKAQELAIVSKIIKFYRFNNHYLLITLNDSPLYSTIKSL